MMRVMMSDGVRFDAGQLDPFQRGLWPAHWISCAGTAGGVWACRLRFEVEQAAVARVHVSADQRYELYLDGRLVGRGPERGDRMHWFYETYDLDLSAGGHVLVARVWWLEHEGAYAPIAQVTLKPGFVLAAEAPLTERLSTGVAAWEAKPLEGYTPLPAPPGMFWWGGTMEVDGARFPWGFDRGEGDGWMPAQKGEQANDRLNKWGECVSVRRLRPARLPAMMDQPRQVGRVRHVEAVESADTAGIVVAAEHHLAAEAEAWQSVLAGRGSLTVAAGTRRRVIVDLEDYYCARAELRVSGGRGGSVRMSWAESLYLDPRRADKGNRDQIEGKRFVGRFERFRPDGPQRTFASLWWNAGRYVEVLVEAAGEALVVEGITLHEMRYPLEMESRIETSDQRFNQAIPIMWRSLQMCAHETYFDCPYYEQLMYTGDTRLQVLTTYVSTRDDRLPRKALAMFDASHLYNGLTQSRYPGDGGQLIPQFSLYFVGMVHDFALWRGDRAMVAGLMPGVRSVLERFVAHIGDDGLLATPEGWDWIDWVKTWSRGRPPMDAQLRCGITNWLLVMTLGYAIELETWMGQAELSRRLMRIRKALAARATEVFWDESRGLMATTPSKDGFSEHAQCFALLSGMLDGPRRQRVLEGLLSGGDLAQATIFFRHYLFEALGAMGRPDAILDRMGLWYDLKGMGFKTTLESPEPSRSDCHAWGAHPLFHAMATLAGIRPAEFGFGRVRIRPQLGTLKSLKATMAHPRGEIRVDLQREGRKLGGTIDLPEGISGELVLGRKRRALSPGPQEL